MAPRKRHSHAEIAAKLNRADALSAEGKRQSEIARELGISIMTFHRWRKERPKRPLATSHASENPGRNSDRERQAFISDLQLENARLRRLVTDLMLDKVKLEENLTRTKK